jgi:hypothetical protein
MNNPVAAERPPLAEPKTECSPICSVVTHYISMTPELSTPHQSYIPSQGISFEWVESNSGQRLNMAHANGYGAVNNSSATSGSRTDSHANGPANEEQPLLLHPASKRRFNKHMMVNVHRDWADVVLCFCYIITGLLDSASISTWGSFVSMQTGLCRIISPKRVK